MVNLCCEVCGLGQCCGAKFSVHWSFSVNLLIQVIFGLLQYGISWKHFLLVLVAWGPSCLLALVFHEWGHIGATRLQRGMYSYSMLWPFGGFNDCTIPHGKCWQEFLIAIAGPLMHIPLMFIWVIVLAIAAPEGVSYYGTVGFDIDRLDDGGGGEWFAQLAKRSLDINIMIFALNLMLPAYPLDAASMVAALCGQCGLSIVRSAWVLVIIGAVLGAGAALMGIVYLVAGSGPGVFLLLMGLYVMYTSWQMHSQIKDGTIYSHPIFKPDCYRRDSPQNNRSPSMPVVRHTPPVSPRRNSGAGLSAPKSKTPEVAMSRPMEQPSSPTRDRRANVGDIEMGNAPRPEKKVKSDSGEKNKKKKKKKIPATNDPTTTFSEGTTADATTGNRTTPKKKKSSGSGKNTPTV